MRQIIWDGRLSGDAVNDMIAAEFSLDAAPEQAPDVVGGDPPTAQLAVEDRNDATD
jgi:hypothetical protein